MGNFNRDRGGSHFGGDKGRGGFGGGRPDFQKRGGSFPAEMHQATCSDCGKSCEVPFKPSGSKPVYCRDCFAKKGGGAGDRFPRRDFNDRSGDRGGEKPRFESNRAQMDSGKGNSEILKMIESVNFKLDRLTKAVEALSGGNNKNSEKVIAKEVTKSEVKVAIETPKKEAKTAVVTKKVAKKKSTSKK
jgi:CxxC-x17-CxxC domain-containing protein